TRRSPTSTVTTPTPISRSARCSPRLLITVATILGSPSWPLRTVWRASRARMPSPSTVSPRSSTRMLRSPSPSSARPKTAACERHRGVAAHLGLDRALGLVGELLPLGGEDLDAVVLGRVVRGADHGPDLEALEAREEREARGGDQPDARRVEPVAHEAAGER